MAVGLGSSADKQAVKRPDPLEHWLFQERARGNEDFLPPDPADLDDRSLPSGWWILPLVGLSLVAWGVLIWAIFVG